MGVHVKCRKCGRTADANSFVLDPIAGMVVCPNCLADRKSKAMSDKLKSDMGGGEGPEGTMEAAKPAGWDDIDEYLAKAVKQKQESPNFKLLAEKRLQCLNCKYVFRYDKERNSPKDCPFCGIAVKVR